MERPQVIERLGYAALLVGIVLGIGAILDYMIKGFSNITILGLFLTIILAVAGIVYSKNPEKKG